MLLGFLTYTVGVWLALVLAVSRYDVTDEDNPIVSVTDSPVNVLPDLICIGGRLVSFLLPKVLFQANPRILFVIVLLTAELTTSYLLALLFGLCTKSFLGELEICKAKKQMSRRFNLALVLQV